MFQEVRAHHEVVVEEVTGVFAIGADATHDGGEVDDDVRAMVGVEAFDAIFQAEVILRTARDGDVAVAPRVEGGDHMASQESCTPGHGDARIA
jgi:hypothetical protein